MPVTKALKVALWPAVSAAVPGDTLILTPCGPETGFATGFRLKLAVALALGSAELVAVTVTVCCEARLPGAVYNPLTMLPTFGLSVHVTPVFVLPVTFAVNWTAWPAVTD